MFLKVFMDIVIASLENSCIVNYESNYVLIFDPFYESEQC